MKIWQVDRTFLQIFSFCIRWFGTLLRKNGGCFIFVQSLVQNVLSLPIHSVPSYVHMSAFVGKCVKMHSGVHVVNEMLLSLWAWFNFHSMVLINSSYWCFSAKWAVLESIQFSSIWTIKSPQWDDEVQEIGRLMYTSDAEWLHEYHRSRQKSREKQYM